MLQALLETNIVRWDEQDGWLRRLDDAAPPAAAAPVAPPACQGCELRAVAVAPEQRLGGLRLTSTEMFEDCVVLRWHLLVEEDPGWRERVHAVDHGSDLVAERGPSALEDDLGTPYRPPPADRVGGWGWLRLRRDPEVLSGASVFTPDVPRSRSASVTMR